MSNLSYDSFKIEKVGVIGAGTMGAGIAQLASTFGLKVQLFDTNSEAIYSAKSKMKKALTRLVEKGKFTESKVEDILNGIEPTIGLSELDGCDIVVEAIIENISIKKELFRNLEEIVSNQTILATNTSSLSIGELANGLKFPQRFIGMHFFNPAPIMKLVEVVVGMDTSKDVKKIVYELAENFKKVPVYTKSTPGFIVNRVARPFYAEGFRLLEEGLASANQVDTIIKKCGGFRMGPFELTDLIGHDVNYAVTESVFKSMYNDPWFQPSLVQKELVDSGHLGKKSGKGFYTYPREDQSFGSELTPLAAGSVLPEKIEINTELPVLSPLISRVKESSPNPLTKSGKNSEYQGMSIDDVEFVLSDGRSAGELERTFNKKFVIFDLCLDFSQSKLLAISVSTKVSSDDLKKLAALFQKASIELLQINDAPGLVVMRTVAMLANLGFDAVHKGICDEASVDTATRFGLNYPRGPINWSKDVSFAHIKKTLSHLFLYYGESRYRTSPLLKQKI